MELCADSTTHVRQALSKPSNHISKRNPFVLNCCKGCPIQVAVDFGMLQKQSSHTVANSPGVGDPIRAKGLPRRSAADATNPKYCTFRETCVLQVLRHPFELLAVSTTRADPFGYVSSDLRWPSLFPERHLACLYTCLYQ